MFDGDEDCIEEDQNDDKPVERLTLDQVTHADSAPDTTTTTTMSNSKSHRRLVQHLHVIVTRL